MMSNSRTGHSNAIVFGFINVVRADESKSDKQSGDFPWLKTPLFIPQLNQWESFQVDSLILMNWLLMKCCWWFHDSNPHCSYSILYPRLYPRCNRLHLATICRENHSQSNYNCDDTLIRGKTGSTTMPVLRKCYPLDYYQSYRSALYRRCFRYKWDDKSWNWWRNSCWRLWVVSFSAISWSSWNFLWDGWDCQNLVWQPWN